MVFASLKDRYTEITTGKKVERKPMDEEQCLICARTTGSIFLLSGVAFALYGKFDPATSKPKGYAAGAFLGLLGLYQLYYSFPHKK